MAAKEYAIGEEFDFGRKRLKVVPHTDCYQCVLCNVDCFTLQEFIGHCDIHRRNDSESVMYIEVNKDKTE